LHGERARTASEGASGGTGGQPPSRLERWYRDAYEDDNLFLTLARRPDLLEVTMGFVRYAYGGASSIEPELFELVRVHLAWKNRCVH
jgi:hypothetical protein